MNTSTSETGPDLGTVLTETTETLRDLINALGKAVPPPTVANRELRDQLFLVGNPLHAALVKAHHLLAALPRLEAEAKAAAGKF